MDAAAEPSNSRRPPAAAAPEKIDRGGEDADVNPFKALQSPNNSDDVDGISLESLTDSKVVQKALGVVRLRAKQRRLREQSRGTARSLIPNGVRSTIGKKEPNQEKP